MNLPDQLKEKLGHNIIQQRLLALCASELGKEHAEHINFSNKLNEVELWLNQTKEFLQIISEGNVPPLGNVVNLSEILERAVIKGNWLAGEELYKVLISLSTSRELSQFIFAKTNEKTSLDEFRQSFDDLRPVELRLSKSIDEEGRLLDSASTELKSIRRKISSEEGALRKKVDSIYRQAKANGMVPEGASISVRDGRLVIPVNAANKRQIQGFGSS